MGYAIEAVTPPTYAPDGSRGYCLEVARTDGSTFYGWIDRTDDGRVIATLDSYPWEYVTSLPVSDSEWSQQWVTDHSADVIGIYGWKA